jgi:hypothetical protein
MTRIAEIRVIEPVAPRRRIRWLGAGSRSGAAERIGAWPATALVTALAAALFLSFVGYGYELSDEGNVLYQILRTYRGEHPYIDFDTGYTPAVFYLNALLFEWFGVSAVPLRILLAIVNATAVLLVFRLALRFAPAAESACAALTYAIFMPFFAGQFAAFNIPYPAWYAVAAWLATELAAIRATETGRRAWIIAAGALAGVTFSFKPNTGLLALGSLVLARCLATAPLRGRLGAWLEGILLGAAFLGVVGALTFEILTEQFLLLGIPALVLLAAAWRSRNRVRRELPTRTRSVGEGMRDLVAVLVGFAGMTGLWLAYFLPQLGWDRFVTQVLLLGAGVERIYLLYYPDVSGWSGVLLGFALALWLLPAAIGRGWIGARGLAALGAAVLIGGVGALLAFGLAPEGLVLSIAMQLENLSYFLIPLLLFGGVVLWSLRVEDRARAYGPDGLREGLGLVAVALVFALLLFLQLYPRIDFMHVVIAMPSALVVGAAALHRFRRWCTAELDRNPVARRLFADGRVRLLRFAILLPVVLALAARALPIVDARIDLHGQRIRDTTPMARAALPVEVERDRDRDLRELRAVADFVSRSTRPDEPIVAFPALAMIPFLTDRTTPVAHDYFFPGRPDHAAEAEMVAAIEETKAPLVVTLNDRLGYFSAAPAYYFILRDYVQRNYSLVRRIGRFDVLARNSLLDERPELAKQVQVAQGFSPAFARGHFRQRLEEARRLARSGDPSALSPEWAERLADVDRQVRGATARALVAAGRGAGGLPAVERAMAPDRRSRLLLLRVLGEYADAGALRYLHDVFLSSDGRLRWEAARSINFILAREIASRYDLVAPRTGPLWMVPDDLSSDEMVGMIDDFAERQRIGPLAALAAARAERRDLAPRLDYFEDEDETTWWRLVAAYALLELGESERVHTLMDTIEAGTLGAQYVPSILLDPDLVAPAEAAGAVAAALRDGGPEERETAAWMVPFLHSREADGALLAARGDPDPRVRHAVEWAAKEIERRRHEAQQTQEKGSA